MPKLDAKAFIAQMKLLPKSHGINAACCSPQAYKQLEAMVTMKPKTDSNFTIVGVGPMLGIAIIEVEGLEPDDVLMFQTVSDAIEFKDAVSLARKMGINVKSMVDITKARFMKNAKELQ